MDNVLVVFKIIHHMKRNKYGTECEVTLKLDISKAYDFSELECSLP